MGSFFLPKVSFKMGTISDPNTYIRAFLNWSPPPPPGTKYTEDGFVWSVTTPFMGALDGGVPYVMCQI